MRVQLNDIPVGMEVPGLRQAAASGGWGGMVLEYIECPDRMDLDPMMEGLPGDLCPCPHWGYMLKGAFHGRYADNAEEVVKEGDAFYAPAGHTGWFEAGSAMVLFSPEAEAMQVAEHLTRKMQG